MVSLCVHLFISLCACYVCVWTYHARCICSFSFHYKQPMAKSHLHLSQRPSFVCANILQSHVKGISWKAAQMKNMFLLIKKRDTAEWRAHTKKHTDTNTQNLKCKCSFAAAAGMSREESRKTSVKYAKKRVEGLKKGSMCRKRQSQ